MRLEKTVTIAWLSTAWLCAQSLAVLPSETGPNKTGTFSVLLDTAADRAPLALQWDLSVPPVIAVRTEDITIGKAAQAAGKSLTCALNHSKKTSRKIRYTCILAGGREPLRVGPVAEVQYRAQWDPKALRPRWRLKTCWGSRDALSEFPWRTWTSPSTFARRRR